MKRTITIFIFTIIIILMSACSAKGDITVIQQPTIVPTPDNTESAVETVIESEYLVDPYQPYTYEMMVEDTRELSETYADYIEVGTIGSSVEGRDITLIKMGTGKSKLLLVGSHHAREYISSTYLMNMIDKYLYAAVHETMLDDYNVKKLLQEVSVFIVPMLNPDGVNLVINGKESAQDVQAVASMAMLKDTYAEWKANINGVDLNRQYPCFWEVKASNTFVPSSEMFKGEDSATEPEVKAMIKLCQNNNFALAASFHTKGEIIYWADSGTVDQIDGAKQIAEEISAASGYDPMPPSEDPAIYGAGFENWFRQDFNKPGLCIELTPSDGTSLPHDDSDFDILVWDKAKDIGAILMRNAAEAE